MASETSELIKLSRELDKLPLKPRRAIFVLMSNMQESVLEAVREERLALRVLLKHLTASCPFDDPRGMQVWQRSCAELTNRLDEREKEVPT